MALACATGPARAQQLTPESPEVLATIERAIAYIIEYKERSPGREALAGLTMLKSGAPLTHARVQSAVETLQKHLSTPEPYVRIDEMYTPCVEILFFLAADPQRFRPEIDKALSYLLSRQKTHGGWGYVSKPDGDTSMTQYAVLALWELSEAGIDVPIEVWENVTNWLLRTQDPSGAFGYQGRDPGSFQRVNQVNVRHSLAAAGLGSLLISAHHLGIGPTHKPSSEVSSALNRVEAAAAAGAPRRKLTSKVESARMAAALADGDRWMRERYTIEPSGVVYQHYYLYTLERYESFRELARGKVEEQYAWYDDGARHLMRTQGAAGSWQSASGALVDTCFSVLFLLRSTQKSLGRAGLLAAGTLVGGRGLPKDMAAAQLRNGEVVAKPLSGPAESLLAVLDDPGDPNYLAAVEGFRAMTLEADEATLNRQAVKLRKLAGSAEPGARLAAVEALARTRDLDNVPILIYALSDPDQQVVATALDGLRFISRKFRGLGEGPIRDEATRSAVIQRWKDWYRTVRPEATFDRE